MSKPHGQAHSGLHARPAIQDAGVASHPAIATTEDPRVYDPSRAAGAEAPRGDAADDRVPVPPGKAKRRKTEAKDVVIGAEKPAALKHGRRLQGRSIAGQARQAYRNFIADEYLTGRQTMRALALLHGVSVFTIRDWTRDRRDTFLIDHRLRPADVVAKRETQSNAAIAVGVFGAGGNMSDEGVRRATRDLEKAIVRGLAARGLAPLPYRREVAA